MQVRARDLEMGMGGRGTWPVLSHFEMFQLQMGEGGAEEDVMSHKLAKAIVLIVVKVTLDS